MNVPIYPETAAAVRRVLAHVPVCGSAKRKRVAATSLSVAACLGLTGCFGFLKPAQPTARNYLLSAMPAPNSPSAMPMPMAVGIGKVKLPAYLLNTSLAVRKGPNEIDYLQSALWAERLDTGFQRVLAANLAVLLPSDRIQMSSWQRSSVAAEVYVAIEQCDVDDAGRGVLVARWRILSPGAETVLKAGSSRLDLQGQSPNAGAANAIATLSNLLEQLSKELAKALQEVAPVRTAPAGT